MRNILIKVTLYEFTMSTRRAVELTILNNSYIYISYIFYFFINRKSKKSYTILRLDQDNLFLVFYNYNVKCTLVP